MQTLFPTKPTPATVVLLAASLLLAIVGIGGVAAGAADKSDSPEKVLGDIVVDTTTTTAAASAVTATSSGPNTTLKSTGTTVKTSATTAAPSAGDCAATPANVNPGAEQPPAIGTYTYISCTDPNSTNDLKVAAGQSSGGVTRREITTSQGELGNATATTSYGSGGIIQEKLVIQAQGVTLECDWNPDILEYPPDMSVGRTWSADSKCTAQTTYGPVNIHAQATRKVSSRVITKIAGAAVTSWGVDSTLLLTFSGGPPARPIKGTVNETSLAYFDPSRGIEVYDKSTSEGTGDFAFPKTTTEQHLKSLTPVP